MNNDEIIAQISHLSNNELKTILNIMEKIISSRESNGCR